MQVNLDPLAARALVGAPLHELAHRTVPLEEILNLPCLVERLAGARDWGARFALLDETLAARIAEAQPSREVVWAWRRLCATHGRVPSSAGSRGGRPKHFSKTRWRRRPSLPAMEDKSGSRRLTRAGSAASKIPRVTAGCWENARRRES